MRFVFLLTLTSFLFISCSKNDSIDPAPDPVTPPAVDTLTAGWQVKKIDTLGRDLNDIIFTSVTTGFTCGFGKAFFKTTDAGTSWQPVTLPVGNNYINIQFLNAQYGFMAANGNSPDGGVMRTNNGGATWQIATNSSQTDVFFVNPAIGFCTNPYGIMKSVDSGKTWVSIVANNGNLSCVWFLNSLKGFVTSKDSGLLKTLDGGATFTTAIRAASSSYLPIYFANATNGCTSFGKNVYVTNDGGNNWSLLKQFSSNVNDVKNTGPNEYYVVTYNEVWHTTDGANWIREIRLSSSDELIELTLSLPGRVWLAGTKGKLYYK